MALAARSAFCGSADVPDSSLSTLRALQPVLVSCMTDSVLESRLSVVLREIAAANSTLRRISGKSLPAQNDNRDQTPHLTRDEAMKLFMQCRTDAINTMDLLFNRPPAQEEACKAFAFALQGVLLNAAVAARQLSEFLDPRAVSVASGLGRSRV